MEPTSLAEGPISAELVLVDPELARSARAALPDPPWLLPVLAEHKQAEVAAPTGFRKEGSPRHMPRVARRPRRRSVTRHIAATLVGGCVLLALTVAVATAADLFRSDELTFSTTPVPDAASPQPKSSAAAHAKTSRKARRSEQRTKRPAKRSEARASVNANTGSKTASSARRSPKPAQTTPRALTEKQRVFSWRRDAAAVYYQFYFQRGTTTIYQARTVKLRVALPARLKLKPGTYQVLVRPAIPGDAGVILGAAIVAKTIRV